MRKSSLEVDVLVVGAGMAGVMAGIALSRENLRVMVVEMTNAPGGQATSTLLSEMSGFTYKGQQLYGGIEYEIIEHLIKVGSAAYHYDAPEMPHPTLKMDQLLYNPEVLKILIDWFVLSSSVQAVGGCRLQSVVESENSVRVVVGGGLDIFEIDASIVIDATGEAEATFRAGFETYRPPLGQEVSTLLFRLSGADHEALANFMMQTDKMQTLVQKGYERNVLPGKYLSLVPVPGTCDVTVNATRAIVDRESPPDLTRGLIETRTQIIKIIPFLKEMVPGLEHTGLAAMGSMMGVRSGRRIVGLDKVTREDILEGRLRPDGVALGCAPMGIHGPVEEVIDWQEAGGPYHIPYAAMIPRQSKRILAAGKCICCDDMASTSIRCVPAVMNTGEVAGHAAAMAIRQKIAPADIDVSDLKSVLKGKGLRLDLE